jgi:hypothetical protein
MWGDLQELHTQETFPVFHIFKSHSDALAVGRRMQKFDCVFSFLGDSPWEISFLGDFPFWEMMQGARQDGK